MSGIDKARLAKLDAMQSLSAALKIYSLACEQVLDQEKDLSDSKSAYLINEVRTAEEARKALRVDLRNTVANDMQHYKIDPATLEPYFDSPEYCEHCEGLGYTCEGGASFDPFCNNQVPCPHCNLDGYMD